MSNENDILACWNIHWLLKQRKSDDTYNGSIEFIDNVKGEHLSSNRKKVAFGILNNANGLFEYDYKCKKGEIGNHIPCFAHMDQFMIWSNLRLKKPWSPASQSAI